MVAVTVEVAEVVAVCLAVWVGVSVGEVVSVAVAVVIGVATGGPVVRAAGSAQR